MSLPTRFELKPLSKMMHVPAISVLLLAAVHTNVQAAQLIGESRTIGPHEMKNDWQLDRKSELTVNGAHAGHILANDSTLNVNAGSRIEDIRATQGSTVNVDGATVESNHSTWGAVRLDDSTAIIRNSAITSNTTFGLQAFQSFNSGKGGIAQVFNSIIRGEKSGAIASGNAELHFNQNTVVEGTGTDSYGVWLDGATATASQSSIIGAKSGVLFTNDVGNSSAGKLVLNNSSVEGRSGSAIVVEGYPGGEMEVEIDVRNGSTLTGGNGVLLEVNGGAQANMNVDNSRLKGDVIVEDGSTARLNLENSSGLKGQLQNVTSLNVGNGSYWELTADSQVGALNLVDGTVIFGHTDAFYQLDLDSLDGNGTFVMGTDFANGMTDFLNISGEANGNHSLLLEASGVEPVSPEEIRIVHTGGGDAQFSLVGDVVDVGAYSYGLKKEGTDWFLDPNNRVISPATRSVMALFNTAPTVWYGEATSLRTRMGELRFEPGQAGVWMRGYGNKYKVAESTGVGYNQSQQGFTLGADTPLADSQWLVGVMAGHSTSDLNLKRGTSGTVKSYYVGAYATWLDEESGLYFDAVAKLNRFHNESKVGLSDGTKSKGKYANTGGGLSAEFGRNIKLDDGFFVEPYAQLSTVVIQGANYNLDNGLHADGERTRSIMAKAGATVGRDIQLDSGSVVQPYLRAAMVHEFANNNKVKVNNNVFNNDLSGSRAEFGAGVAVKLSQNLQLHADLEHSSGGKVEQPWGANVGVRYSW
ncbi:autotransporter outer membrane beta-barrel domain-containing protein [Pseudomonas gessardii]|uniref:Autotransporter outer membrane beta-barrel domain-containing protein n=1 Tax=Pseudomonas gessardii TaxID=78544 RepID=A0ABS9F7A6_9PSED|nr:autotransporter outer membrane beta-barrel domain-containing protein [Pseudomonas gessardii]MCF4981110.1 autotransporter outer membrane beta-barrel domain-containing protein [Pseudomonas gessardii]MCF4992560.1 autotransporter outer membrane beta-barrel domain-containing protein [Pseudomonas gessardii]MCF5086879.1 autotransporter outer membrane beta-barrel domain-containing protein [Pseudomonas gessardii]MCF5096319.1 autotransporter outer membrane beta-barrel domain-containing protein [Pseudo